MIDHGKRTGIASSAQFSTVIPFLVKRNDQVMYMSRWNELRSSSTAPFFGRSAGWSSGEAFGRCKEQYSTVRECCSTSLSNYGSRTHRRYIMAPPPTPKSYKYSSPFGLGEIQSVWCTSDWQPRNRFQTSDSAPGHPSPLGSVDIPRQSLQLN